MDATQICETLNTTKSFGSNSKVHRPLGNRFGIVKDVHKDITDNEFDTSLFFLTFSPWPGTCCFNQLALFHPKFNKIIANF